MNSRFWQTGWSRWALFILGWTILSLLFVPETYLYFLYRGEAIPLRGTLVLALVNAAIALFFLPVIVWLTRRHPIDYLHWRKSLLIHIPSCLVFSLSYSWLYAGLCYASPGLFHMLFIRFHPNILTYWAIVGFTQAMDYFARYTEREKELAQAELHLLKSQLQPHFLFNTLHAISAMMHEDVKRADRMVNRLSELLRMTLENIGTHEVPLREELAFLKSYLEIENLRFEQQLELKLDIQPEALDTLVPGMLLQPLAENSIRHGFGSRRKGTISLRANRHGDRLILRLSDNGCGFPSNNLSELPHGLGLSNTSRRLEQLYPGSHELQLENLPGGGASLSLEIPFHTAPAGLSGIIAELITDENSRADRRRRALGQKTDRYAPQI